MIYNKNMKGGSNMITYKRLEILGFDYEISDLCGHAVCYIHSNETDNNILYKYIDEEHNVKGGGYFSRKEAAKSFKNKIKALAA